MRHAWVLLLVAAGCEQTPVARHVTPAISVEQPPTAPVVSAAPRPARIPPKWQGRYAVADSKAITTFDVGPQGVEKVKEIYISKASITALAITPDGEHFVFSEYRDGAASTGALVVLPASGGDARDLTACEFACSLGGVSADGDVWFVDLANTSKIGPVSRVPLHGGTKTPWPPRFADCHVQTQVSPDGGTLLIGVSNALGWPSCIDGSHQGFYLLSLAAGPERDVRPPRVGCFSEGDPTKMNINIESMAFDGPDRILVTVVDGWSQPTPIPGMPIPSWSCQRDGQDARRVDEELVLRAAYIDKQGWVVATRADTNPYPLQPPAEDAKPLTIAGPTGHITDFVRVPAP